MSSAHQPPKPELGTLIQADLVTLRPISTFIANSSAISLVRLSPDSMYLAYGDQAGLVTIRFLGGAGNKIRVGNAGSPIRGLLFHPTNPRTLVIAASNGYVNTWEFGHDPDEPSAPVIDYLKAVKIRGFVGTMSFNKEGTLLAIGYDTRVQLVPFPFPEGEPQYASGPHLPIAIHFGPYSRVTGQNIPLSQVPLKYQPIPRGVHFLGEETILVTFLSYAHLYRRNIDGAWEFASGFPAAGGSEMASSAISESGKHLAVSSLGNTVDWYSVAAQKFQMGTYTDGGAAIRSYIHEVAFLDESTLVSGHNLGCIVITNYGNSRRITTQGIPGDHPCQTVTAVRTSTQIIIAFASGAHVYILTIVPTKGQASNLWNPTWQDPSPVTSAAGLIELGWITSQQWEACTWLVSRVVYPFIILLCGQVVWLYVYRPLINNWPFYPVGSLFGGVVRPFATTGNSTDTILGTTVAPTILNIASSQTESDSSTTRSLSPSHSDYPVTHAIRSPVHGSDPSISIDGEEGSTPGTLSTSMPTSATISQHAVDDPYDQDGAKTEEPSRMDDDVDDDADEDDEDSEDEGDSEEGEEEEPKTVVLTETRVVTVTVTRTVTQTTSETVTVTPKHCPKTAKKNRKK